MSGWEVCSGGLVPAGLRQHPATCYRSEVCPGPEQPQPHRATHPLSGAGGLRRSLPQVDFECGGAGEWSDTKGC